MKWKYLNKFLSLKCAGDVLNAVNGINRAPKEITESMSIINVIRSITLKDPMKWTVVDLCSGNSLTGILAVHLLPVKEAIAYDKRNRSFNMKRIKRFEYNVADIYNDGEIRIPENSIIISVHPCGKLALQVIDIYNKRDNAKHLALMPCCVGNLSGVMPRIVKLIGKYEAWSYKLSILANGSYKRDNHCISPANSVITASKGE